MRRFLWIFLSNIFILLTNLGSASCIENVDILTKKNPESLTVSIKITPSIDFVEDFKSGLGKNIQILVELYKRWSIIPDEFITGVKIQRALISDPIKEEYIVKNIEGNTVREKRFKNSTDALNWGLTVDLIEFNSIKNFEPGKYYVKVTVESNLKKLPLLLEHFLFFIPKYDKRIIKESERFDLP